ncbi:MAG: hypothetical protein U0X91_15340 [Spirosomataceae bacterium]
MKPVTFILLYGLLFNSVFAQKIIGKQLPFSPNQTVNLNFKYADTIQVEYWDKAEVSVRIEALINQGKLNEVLVVETASDEKEVSVTTDFDKALFTQGREEDCPGPRSHLSYTGNGQKYYACGTINYQVYLPKQAKLKIETVTGNITIRGASGAVYAKAVIGFVDFSWPDTKGANLAIKTIRGEVYTDLDIDFKTKVKKDPNTGYALAGTVNGGGPEVYLESTVSDLFIRKQPN